MNDDASESLAAARLIDARCDEFERALAAGLSPVIESFLTDLSVQDRQTLLLELLGLEIDYRVTRGDELPVSDYTARFPELPSEQIATLIKATRASQFAVPAQPPDGSASLQPTLLAPANGEEKVREIPAASPKVVRYFGDYELLREIARGGMGVVYEARQRSLNRPVALKMILAGQFAHGTEIERFKREAESAAQLDHPNIVPVFETGEYEGQYFFSMGFIDGQSLSHRIAQGALEPREAAALLKTVTDAIAYAHTKKIVHRDLKPGNILIDRVGTPRITDFGLAKTLDSGSDLTSTGQVMGTPSYMPPEQALGQVDRIGPRSDVYSLGAILYCLLTGKPPFQGDSVVDTLKQVVDREPRSISAVRSGVPIDLVTICSKCLEKNPDSRYQSAGELAADLQRFLEGRPIAARPVSRAEHVRRWVLRNRVVSSLMALVFLVAVSGTIAYSFQRTATDVALGKVAEEQAANQKTSLQSAETRARAIQAELAILKTTVEPNRHQKALQLIREAARIRTEVLAKDEWNSPETRPFWDEQETLLRTEAIEWLSHSTLDRQQELNLDARTYADSNSHSGSNSGANWPAWLAVDPVGNRLAVCRANQKPGSPVPAHVVELFDLDSGGHIAEFPLDEKSCLFPRPEAIAFSGDGKRLHVVVFSLSTSRERVIQTFAMPDGSLVSSGTVSRDSFPDSQQFRFDTDGKRVLILGGAGPVLWDLVEQHAIKSTALNSALGFSHASNGILSFTGDGLITTSGGQGLVTRNILTSDVVRELKLPSRYRSPVHSADGRWLVELKAPEGTNFNQQGVDLGILDAQSGEEFSKLVGVANNVQMGMINNVAEFRDPPLLAVSPDKPYAAVLSREELIACELPQGNVIARRKLDPPNAGIKKLIGLKFIGSDRLLTLTEVPPGPGQASQAGAMPAANRFQIQTWELSVSQLSPSKTVQIQHAPLDLAVAPAGDILATVGPMNVIRTFTAAGLPYPMAKRPFRGMFGLSPANTMLIEDTIFSQDGVLKSGTQIRSWNLATRQPRTFDPGRSVGYAFNRSEFSSGLPIKWPRTTPLLAVPNGGDSGVTILDADSQAKQYSFTSPSWSDIRKVEIHPSDRYLMIQTNPPIDSATAGDRPNPSSKSDYSLTVVRHPGGQPVVTIPRLLADPLFSAKHHVLVGVEPVGLTAYDLESGLQLARLKHESVATMPVERLSYGSSLSPTGKQVVVMTQKASAYQPLLWDLTDGSVSVLETTWSSQESKQIRWNSDGTHLVLTGRKPSASAITLEVWDTAKRQKLATSAGRGAAPYSDTPQFIADTELLYLGVSSNNGQTSAGEVWDLTTGETIRKHSRGASRISANGKFMVLFPESSQPPPAGKVTYQVIETISGNELHAIADTPLSFSPDGQLLLCAEPLMSAKAPLVLWNVASKLRIPLLVEAQLSYSGTGPYAFDPKG